MKKALKKIYNKIELHRYIMLAKDKTFATIYIYMVKLFYPILGSKFILCSKITNHRNREGCTLNELICNTSKSARHKRDMVLCWYLYHIVPWEYKLYHFEKQSHKERLNWLSDADRFMCCELLMGKEPYLILKDKFKFYSLLKNYYKRPMFPFTKSTTREEFNEFIKSFNGDLFVKPLDGSLGKNTFVVTGEYEKSLLYKRLEESEENWFIEGKIIQSNTTAMWNQTSVNTVRIPSIRINNEWHILQPFFRTGRKGQVVDNAGAGGILCVVNSKTGEVETDGYDENSNYYVCHPDSHHKYKGWKLPNFAELVELTERIHKELPSNFHYVGFDFAYTDKGEWDLIEGNWGQFLGQIAEQKGIKRQFDSFLHIYD